MDACRCPNYGLQHSYHDKNKTVMKVLVLGHVKERKGSTSAIIHVAKVLRSYTDSNEKKQIILIRSYDHSCGVQLSKGKWLVTVSGSIKNGKPEAGVYNTMACNYHRKWASLSEEDIGFLNTRVVCGKDNCFCGDWSKPTNCLIDPCDTSKCETEGAICTSNYCGGCKAEWIDTNSGSFTCA